MEDVFYPGPFSFRMGLGRGEPKEFFRARAGDELDRRAERNPRQPPGNSLRPDARGRAVAGGVQQQLAEWGVIQSPLSGRELPRRSPDYLLLEPDDNGMPTSSEAVCVSPSWAFEEKSAGLSTGFTPWSPRSTRPSRKGAQLRAPSPARPTPHQLGPDRHCQLNQHPALNLPRLTAETDPVSVCFGSSDRPSSPSQRPAVSSSASASRPTRCQSSKPTRRAPDSSKPSKPCPPKSPNTKN